jgi:nucleoside 2-deoxyribosyltransferase
MGNNEMTSTTRIYLASATEQYALVERYADELRRRDFEITFEWTPDVRASGFKPDSELSDIHRRYVAKMDSFGVKEAGLVWVLTPTMKEHGCGMWVEMGMAIALGKRVVVSGPLARRTVFAELCEAVIPSHDAAFDYICKKAVAA